MSPSNSLGLSFSLVESFKYYDAETNYFSELFSID